MAFTNRDSEWRMFSLHNFHYYCNTCTVLLYSYSYTSYSMYGTVGEKKDNACIGYGTWYTSIVTCQYHGREGPIQMCE